MYQPVRKRYWVVSNSDFPFEQQTSVCATELSLPLIYPAVEPTHTQFRLEEANILYCQIEQVKKLELDSNYQCYQSKRLAPLESISGTGRTRKQTYK